MITAAILHLSVLTLWGIGVYCFYDEQMKDS